MKPLIICLVGESGSGKTLAAEYIEFKYDIYLIRSYTDRPKRTPDEKGHTFLTKEEFDQLKEEDMIASTEWSGYRYCCLRKDIQPENIYVIDEHGLLHLKQFFHSTYNIYSIRLKRPQKIRIESVGIDRVARDMDKFKLFDKDYDFVINNFRNKRVFLLDQIDEAIRTIRKWHNK